MSEKRLNFREALPEGVIKLQEEGAPRPALYVGSLYEGDKDTEAAALNRLREEVADIPLGPGDEPVEYHPDE